MIKMTEKRFTIIYNEHSEMMQYVDNQKEEPNRWAIWNASETAQKLNKLNDENEELKQSNQKAIELMLDGIVEMHDGKRDYAETLFNKAIELIKK